jgi:hypothetical protein
MSASEQDQERFNEFILGIQRRITALESVPAPSAPVSSKIKVSLPEKFDGRITKYRDFLASVRNYFVLQGNQYSSDEIKVRFIGTLLTGDPLTWFRGLVESDSPSLYDLETFLQDFQDNYDDPYARHHAQAAIRRLRQGKGSVVSYASKFRRLASDTGFNDEAKIEIFKNGLIDEVKDVLAGILDEPPGFEQFINFCIKIDHRLYARRVEKKKPSGSDLKPSASKKEQQSSAHADPSAMDVDAVQASAGKSKKLSQEERTRRLKENLCLYCGEPDHRLASCPKKSKN